MRALRVPDLGPDEAGEPIVWAERSKNQLADTLCNRATDSQRSREKCQTRPGPNASCASVVSLSDGGRRSPTCSASAWALAVGTQSPSSRAWSYVPPAAGGSFHAGDVSPSPAEALALEACALAFWGLFAGA